jgi:hypothetical protein
VLAVFIFAVALQLASPVPSPSPIGSPTPVPLRWSGSLIEIPVTWQTVPVVGHGAAVLGFWNDGTSGGERIEVRTLQSDAYDAKTIAALYRQLVSQRAAYVSGKPVQLCHGAAGWEDRFHDSSGGGYALVYGVTPTRGYVATLAYPGYPGASAEGQAAVESLCPPGDPIAHAGPPPIEAPAAWTTIPAAIFPAAFPTSRTVWQWTRGSHGPGRESLVVWKFGLPTGFHGITIALDQYMRGKSSAGRIHRSPIPLCGTYDGGYVEMHAVELGVPVAIESVVTVADHTEYLAAYERPASQPADPRAERAVRSLCPKPS